ncbi:hypothetical protein BYT27DRAFT_7204430, partial [Phlegmacium glaucopus]
MFSYTFSTASTYCHLPVAEPSTRKPPLPPPSRINERDNSVVNTVLSNDDLYQILGVSKQPTLDKMSLRHAYLSRSKACHL